MYPCKQKYQMNIRFHPLWQIGLHTVQKLINCFSGCDLISVGRIVSAHLITSGCPLIVMIFYLELSSSNFVCPISLV